jgi:hypothetical protein
MAVEPEMSSSDLTELLRLLDEASIAENSINSVSTAYSGSCFALGRPAAWR